ncbi:ribonuclease D [Halomonas urumqiensis]|uniref:Ribonuclease D n=1 Tax=Halomonas urumqiensis TaxID=1684789 RepID=A0A2N7UFC8_9GAMM|nr:ribonuclease D [Halomonas urumqiensis]PMR79152.1 ribonuclease D [Halomonas urumqiensis]PTB03827.1 ribonuclease D [Halomonas urumqiensis]GHE19939.1 ribonuclease D [Halomonas urumqiensis]
MPLSPDIRWIDTPAALDAACAEVVDAHVIALDTEFFRENTFHPVPALIQFSAGGPAWLIDPLEVECTEAFRQLLATGPLKLLHAASEDLEVFAHWAGVPPAPLIDTQVVQSLLGDVPSMGYQKLVETWVGETLPKDETRSDWLKRPLTQTQKQYAALDVVYLVKVWELQREALERHGRMAWAEADCAELVEQATRSVHADGQWYLRQRQLWRLSPRQIEAYRRLTIWREGEARARNLPRGWLVHDRVLYAIAEQLPENRYELSHIEGVKPGLIKRDGDQLLGLVAEARHLDDGELPNPMHSPVAPDFKKRIKALKKVVNAEAETQGVAPEVLLRRRELEALVTADLDGQPLPLPVGWRGERLNTALGQALEELAT